MSPSTAQAQRVLILGAGVGGLALAQGLRKHGVEFAVYECDDSISTRKQGYRIKILEDTAQELQYLLVPELWEYFKETCAVSKTGENCVNAVSGTVIACRSDKGPKVDQWLFMLDRSVLRKLLVKGIEASIHWGRSFSHYETNGSTVSAVFDDGSTEIDLTIDGADGARSRVHQQLLLEHKPVDTEGFVRYGKSPLTAELMENYPPHLRRWITMLRDEPPLIGSAVFGEDPITMHTEPVMFSGLVRKLGVPDDYIYWILQCRNRLFAANEAELEELLHRSTRELSLFITSEWHPKARALLECQDEPSSTTTRILSFLLALPEWRPTARVTLLGDPIHLMSPNAGLGAVTTIKSAVTLCQATRKHGISDTAMAEHEGKMREHAWLAITISEAGGKMMVNQPPLADGKVVDW